MAGNSNYPPAYAILGEQIGSLIAAKDQRIQRLEEEIRARDDRSAQARESHDHKIGALNDTLNQRAQQVQSLSLEVRQLKASVKALVSNSDRTDTPPKSPASDGLIGRSPTKRSLQGPTQRNMEAIAAARLAHTGFTVLAQEDTKCMEKSHRGRDEGAELRELAAEWKPSRMRIEELKPGVSWKPMAIAQADYDDEEMRSESEEVDQKTKRPNLKLEIAPSGPRLPDRKHSLPDLDDAYRRRKPVCAHCWATSSWCDFYGQCGSCRIAKVRCVRKLCDLGLSCRNARCPAMHPGQWDEDDEDWVVEAGGLGIKARAR